MKNRYVEFLVGLFLAIGIACLAFLSIRIARKEFFSAKGYEVQAVFSNCSGIRKGSQVMLAGVEIGRVKGVSLEDYEARVVLALNPKIQLQKDAIASIKTKGLIGEKYIEISPGGADERIGPGGRIRDTEPAVDFESLVSKFVHGNLPKPTNQ